jgi:GNAT superfamily N-acetyltransferase
METVKGFEILQGFRQFTELTGALKRTFNRKTISNCLLLPDDISRYADERRVLFAQDSSLLTFLLDMGSYDLLYFYIAEGESIPAWVRRTPARPTAIDFLYSNSRTRMNAALYSVEALMVENGFQPNMNSIRMVCNIADAPTQAYESSSSSAACKGGISIATARSDDEGGLLALWRGGFEPISNNMPTDSDLLRSIRSGCAVVAKGEHGKTIGGLIYDKGVSSAYLRHIIVSEDMRGMGLFGRMFSHCTNRALSDGISRIFVMVQATNSNAIDIYAHYGFKPDGIRVSQLIIS